MRRLTQKFVNGVSEPGRYHYGDLGLMLVVRSATSKSFIQRVTVNGRRRDIGLGSARWVTLDEAKNAAWENMKSARTGGDPSLSARNKTFEEAVERVIKLHEPTWKHKRTADQFRNSLRDHAFKQIGQKNVSDITSADVLAIVGPIWNTKRDMARKVRQRIAMTMNWAQAEGLRADNPCDALSAALPKAEAGGKRHLKALPYADVPGAIMTVRDASRSGWAVKRCFEFMVLTACRSGEARGARWSEIDLENRLWTIPAERMKANREHQVPLGDRLIEILAEAQGHADHSGLVFPSRAGKPMSDMALSKMLRSRQIDAVPHGFRSSFRQWAAERTNFPREVAEFALAHNLPDRVEAAYQRGTLVDKRRDLMERWEMFLFPKSADVIKIG